MTHSEKEMQLQWKEPIHRTTRSFRNAENIPKARVETAVEGDLNLN
jgi:hypothetical protein